MKVIHVLRKPTSEGTVASNVLRWGTGALHVDGCRVGTSDGLGGGATTQAPWGYVGGRDGPRPHTGRTGADQKGNEGWIRPWMADPEATAAHADRVRANVAKAESLGRWPANVLHDGSSSVVGSFPDTGTSTGSRIGNAEGVYTNQGRAGWGTGHEAGDPSFGDNGSAARYFQTVRGVR